jgi:hypothetical protein
MQDKEVHSHSMRSNSPIPTADTTIHSPFLSDMDGKVMRDPTRNTKGL